MEALNFNDLHRPDDGASRSKQRPAMDRSMNNDFNNDFWMMAMIGSVLNRRTNKQIEQTNALLDKIRRQGLSPAERAAEDAAKAAAKAAEQRRAAREMAICKAAMILMAVLVGISLYVSLLH
jgi:hypothetical protein